MSSYSNHASLVRCRQIADNDIEAVTALLAQGFASQRTQEFWSRALDRLAHHTAPPNLPKYGYLLENAGVPVGVILLISSVMRNGTERVVRCNVSSWYVVPQFRCYASMLVSHALKHEHVTYLNITPAPHTWPMIAAQGYSRYSNGQFVAVPLLSSRPTEAPAHVVSTEVEPRLHIDPIDRDILREHAAFGCISLWCTDGETAYPFVFLPRVVRFVPCAQLVYCRDMDDFARCARTIGWHLARSGRFFVIMDANGPIPGLVGKYFENRLPRFFKGPDVPRLGDLAYTETAMFGV